MLPVIFRTFFVALFISLFLSCGSEKSEKKIAISNPPVQAAAPEFNADSAYAFVQAQCDFGPRVPNTKSHAACGDYLEGKLKQYTPHVLIQTGKVTTYNGVTLNIKNMIAQFNPAAQKRILLFAHWDTRPWADRDSV